MPGRGRPPKPDRINPSDVPIRGEWQAAPGVGWQHGAVPDPPPGLLKAARDAWATWMASWVAAHWSPDDLPSLRHTIRLLDQCERGELQRSAELRMWMDTLGITPKGQQDRRWARPVAKAADTSDTSVPRTQPGSRYAHLRPVVNE